MEVFHPQNVYADFGSVCIDLKIFIFNGKEIWESAVLPAYCSTLSQIFVD